MAATLGFETVLNRQALVREILRHLALQLTVAFARAAAAMTPRLRAEVEAAVRRSPEMESLASDALGSLHGQLGVEDNLRAVDQIARIVADTIRITPRPVRSAGSGLEGGLTIEAVSDSLAEVLSLSLGSFATRRGQEIPWLRWLLTGGGAVLVKEYHFVPGTFRQPRSRTGQGLMRRGGSWSVPTFFQGVAADNFLTRALAGLAPLLETILFEELEKAF